MSISVAIVIPVYREASYIESTLNSIEKSIQYSIEKNWIPHVVLVVNNPTSVSSDFRKDNALLIQSVADLKKTLTYPVDILDYTDPGLTNGVGEARRIGMSYAIAKYLKNPDDRVISLDADCIVDLNYVSTLFNLQFSGSGFTFYFEHDLDSPAMIYYELYLRYLRWGLQFAESPFAFYAVGSCFGTNVKNYHKSGGIPSKSATEDFHFLNKLRRHGPIQYVTETTVHPSSRLSQRVTLGTGYFLTDAKTNFDQAFSKLMLPSVEEFSNLKKILHWFTSYDGGSLVARFEQENLSDIYKQLAQSGVIEKIHRIFETTRQSEAYQTRLMEVIDGLETLRILRSMWVKRAKPAAKEIFLEWCTEIWSISDYDNAQELLIEVRKLEKNT